MASIDTDWGGPVSVSANWRRQEAGPNSFPRFIAELDGVGIHFIHRRGTGPDSYPLVITRGWPGTGFDMGQPVPLLADPAVMARTRRARRLSADTAGFGEGRP